MVTPHLAFFFFVTQVYSGEFLHYASFPIAHVLSFQEINLILAKNPDSVISRVYPASSMGM